ncbi:DciA family protein [Amycolatopsis sp. NPDC059657]|uniref:DciA family protein n=1 Tax=Amycolatopsis sp. NPDC059657 TaxID=3346899 RepID=UPI00366D5AB6
MTKGPDRTLDLTHTGERAAKAPNSRTQGDKSAAPNGAEPARSPGRDLVQSALDAAREKAKARGVSPGTRKPRVGGSGGQSPRRRRWSGPGADTRDPQPLGRLASRIALEHGWSTRLSTGQVFGQWGKLVGEDVAEHAQPVALKDGELTVRASSTAWATQLRLLQGQLLAKIAAGVGHGVVKRMRIQGPTAPSWRKGLRHVPGRGPRDTYG